MGWYLWQLSLRKWISPTVGRKDHTKNYCFENIEMQEFSENRRERYHRRGRPGPAVCPVFVLDSKLEPVAFFDTAQKAALFYGISNERLEVSKDWKNMHWTSIRIPRNEPLKKSKKRRT